jgi:hypothetical protein
VPVIGKSRCPPAFGCSSSAITTDINTADAGP